jgi:hypothetical protein
MCQEFGEHGGVNMSVEEWMRCARSHGPLISQSALLGYPR